MNPHFDSDGRRIAITEPAELQGVDSDFGETDLRVPGLQFDNHESIDLTKLDHETQKICVAFAAEAVWKFAILIADEKKPKRAVYSILYAIGAASFVGGTATSIANTFGTSKQNLLQQGQKLLYSLGLRKAPLAKPQRASKNYSDSNHRHKKVKVDFE